MTRTVGLSVAISIALWVTVESMRFFRVQNNFAAGGDLRRGAVHLIIS